ncbi:rRNA maturation RNase YbeY [Lujinxingia vulgaris]|uniref:Endoribonuclease YbeY n=1 Tax=Lujinxingia vulgaris TaxID=2600176 RepID=A0A5C6XI12_9DELT|nr:rRNA maturation RNase YbeY [Lujinxingia vulgaris]
MPNLRTERTTMPVEIMRMGSAQDHPQAEAIAKTITRALETTYRALELRDPELSVVLTDDDEIRQLNRQWRGEDHATDVLSFPLYEADELPEDPVALGDIIISLPYAERLVASEEHRHRLAEAAGVDPSELRWTLVDEVSFLFVHGLLHLIGHDHAEPEEEAVMRAEERRVFELMTSALETSTAPSSP